MIIIIIIWKGNALTFMGQPWSPDNKLLRPHKCTDYLSCSVQVWSVLKVSSHVCSILSSPCVPHPLIAIHYLHIAKSLKSGCHPLIDTHTVQSMFLGLTLEGKSFRVLTHSPHHVHFSSPKSFWHEPLTAHVFYL